MSNPRKKKMTEVSFKQVLKALVDQENVFPAGYIHKLSRLDTQQAKDIEAIWGQIPLERRRALLEDMDEFISSDFLLSFSVIARVALDDVDGVVRTFGLRILATDENPANITAFLRMMKDDPDETVRAAAASSCGQLVFAGEMGDIPDASLRKIEEALFEKINGNDSDEVRRRALEALGFSSRPELSDLIAAALQKGSQKWLISALFAIGHSLSEEWSDKVLESLADQRPLVRAEAATAAGELELTDAVPALIGLLDDASAEVRAACIWSLSQIGGEGVRDRLQLLLDECQDEDEAELIEEAIDNLDFNEEFLPVMLNVDGDDMEDDMDEDEDEDDPEPPLGRATPAVNA